MNLNAKVALSLILGASTLLSACDTKENTSTQVEKAVRVPAPTEKAESNTALAIRIRLDATFRFKFILVSLV